MFPKEEETLAPPLLQASQISYDKATVKRGTVENDINATGDLISVSQKDFYFQYSGGVLERNRAAAVIDQADSVVR